MIKFKVVKVSANFEMSFWCHPFDQNSNEIIVRISALLYTVLYNRAEILLFWTKQCLHKIISVFTDLYIKGYDVPIRRLRIPERALFCKSEVQSAW